MIQGSCLTVSVDGTDFRIREPRPFCKSWYSHKFKAAGLRYELAISVSTGEIVRECGPFPCGSFPDLKIFRLHLKQLLENCGEKAIADQGYQYPTCVTNSNDDIHKRVRARYEGMNGRLKNFLSCLICSGAIHVIMFIAFILC